MYNKSIKIIYDENKDIVNQTKHGVSLALATDLEWDWLQVAPDIRKDYGEFRMIGFAPTEDRVYCVDRDQQRRIISLRKANKREVKSYLISQMLQPEIKYSMYQNSQFQKNATRRDAIYRVCYPV